MSDYLVCPSHKGLPRMHHRVCEEKCTNVGACSQYKGWCVNKVKEEVKDKSKRSPELKKNEALLRSITKALKSKSKEN